MVGPLDSISVSPVRERRSGSARRGGSGRDRLTRGVSMAFGSGAEKAGPNPRRAGKTTRVSLRLEHDSDDDGDVARHRCSLLLWCVRLVPFLDAAKSEAGGGGGKLIPATLHREGKVWTKEGSFRPLTRITAASRRQREKRGSIVRTMARDLG